MSDRREFTVFHLFCGSGGGALGFARGHARVGSAEAGFRTLGGIDADSAACKDFGRLVGVPATCLDLFSREQHEAFHGTPPPAGWTEATHHDLRKAAGWQNPDVVFLSPPCKGLSGLLSAKSAKTKKYRALNQLVPRGLRLMLDAFGDDPPSLVLLENVPRIATRGRDLLDEVIDLLEVHGYNVTESTHDCGELGGLAQHRKRFLLVARHRGKVRPFLYEPPRQTVHGIGEVIGQLPSPDAPEAGAMHRCPRLTWKTWVRLALIPAGKDWRALRDLDWERYRVVGDWGHHNKMRVEGWEQPAHTVIGADRVGSGALSIGDPRLPGTRHNNVYRLARWDEPSPAVTAGGGPSSGGLSVADPRPPRDLGRYQPYGVVPWSAASGTVTGQAAPGAGSFSVADPRLGCSPRAGAYGVLGWDEAARAVIGAASHDNSAVADPRLPADGDRPDPVPLIVALDGTWHRPLTTLELAALQGYPVTDAEFTLEGLSHSSWRNRIGNSVPPPTAEAIASTMLHTLLLEDLGQSFVLSAAPIWVRPLAIALAVPSTGGAP